MEKAAARTPKGRRAGAALMVALAASSGLWLASRPMARARAEAR